MKKALFGLLCCLALWAPGALAQSLVTEGNLSWNWTGDDPSIHGVQPGMYGIWMNVERTGPDKLIIRNLSVYGETAVGSHSLDLYVDQTFVTKLYWTRGMNPGHANTGIEIPEGIVTEITFPYSLTTIQVGFSLMQGALYLDYDPSQVKEYKARVHLHNTSPWQIFYRLVHDGVTLTTINLPGVSEAFPNGEEWEQVFTLPNENPIEIFYAVEGAGTDGLIWSKIGEGDPDQFNPGASVTPVEVVGGADPPPSNGPEKMPEVPGATPKGSSGIWEAPDASSDTALTNKVFTEGVDKLASKMNTIGGGGGGGGDTGALEEGQEEGNAYLQKIDENIQDERDVREAALADANAANASREAAGVAAQAAAQAQMEAVPTTTLPTMSDGASGNSSFLEVEIPGIATLNFDPASNPSVSSVAGFLKACIAWFIIACFQWWLWTELRDVYVTLSGAQQARGNPVVGGTGAQATALVAALAITGILVSVPGLFWGLADSGFAGFNLSTSPFASASGAASAAVYLFTFFVPVGTLLAVIGQVFFVRKGGLIIIAGVQALIRFVVP